MPTTSPDGIYFADGATAMSAESISAAEATSVQNALDSLIHDSRQLQAYDWANSAARTAQTGMTEGALGYQRDTDTYYTYDGSAWETLIPSSDAVIPNSVTNGSFDPITGVITSTAQTLVRVRTAFPSTFRVFQIDYDVTTSAAAGLNARFAVDATDAITAYDNQRFTAVNATAAAVQSLNAAEIQVSSGIGAINARHVGQIMVTTPNTTDATMWNVAGVASANPMTSATGLYNVSGLHRTLTAYNSFTIFAGAGNVTVNRMTVKGVS